MPFLSKNQGRLTYAEAEALYYFDGHAKGYSQRDPGLDETLSDQAVSGSERSTELYVDGPYVSAARLQKVTTHPIRHDHNK